MKRKNNHIILLLVAIIAMSSFFIYLPTANSGFIWDDIQYITNPLRTDTSLYSYFLGRGVYYRPFLSLSMTLDYSISHLNPAGYHMTNIILHTLNSFLVFLLGFHLMKDKRLIVDRTDNAGMKYDKTVIVPFLAAMVFAVHPIHTESVAWIAGRTDMLSTLFFLLAFIAFVIYSREGKGISLVFCSILFLFSLFSKENAVALIAIVPIYGMITKMPKKKMFLASGALLAAFGLYVILRQGGVKEITAVPGSQEGFYDAGLALSNVLKMIAAGTGYYFEKILLPFNLNLLPSIPENPIYYLIFFLPFAIGAFLFYKGKRMECFLLAWIIITLVPSLVILFSQMANPLGERYLYLPSVGFSILLILFLSKIRNRPAFVMSLLLVFSVYTVSTIDRTKAWENDTTLWEETVKTNPRSLYARINYGSSLLRTGDRHKAKSELITALKMKDVNLKDVSTILYLMGEAELEEENYVKAEKHFIDAQKADPSNVAVFNGLGYVYFHLSGLPEITAAKKTLFVERAIKSYEHALKLSPRFYKPMYYLALTYMKKGDLDNAEKYFKSVIALDSRREFAANATKFLMLIERKKLNKST
jgi:tetratricopeptide (TPR) repeat protein